MSSGGGNQTESGENLATNFSKLNVNATEFVPSFGGGGSVPEVSVENNSMQVDPDKEQSPVMATNKGGTTADSWEDAADHSTASSSTAGGGATGGGGATTPEEEDNSMETDAPHVPASKPKTKVKPKPEEATTTEKEHVNIVFIGHVGKREREREREKCKEERSQNAEESCKSFCPLQTPANPPSAARL